MRQTNSTQRVKLYKAHKLWLAAGIATAIMTFGVATGVSTPVQAADATTSAATDTVPVTFNYVDTTDGSVIAPAEEYNLPVNYTGKLPTHYNDVVAELRAKGYYYLNGAPSSVSQMVKTDPLTFTLNFSQLSVTVTHDKWMADGASANGWGAVIPNDSIDESHLNETVTQTIHYVDANGKTVAPDQTQSADFYRSGTVNLVTGKATYTDWKTDATATKTSPTVAGYTPDQASVTLANEDDPTDVTVTYKPNAQSTSVALVDADDGNKLIKTVPVTGVTDGSTKYDVTADIPTNYELAPDQSATGTVNFTANGAPQVTVALKHKTASDLTRTNTETIHYQYADGTTAAPDATETATATRSAVVDLVTGKAVSYSDWVNGSFAAVTSPAIAGYTASAETIPAVANVNADAETTVMYSKNTLPDTGSKTNNGSTNHSGSKTNNGSTSGKTGSKTSTGAQSGAVSEVGTASAAGSNATSTSTSLTGTTSAATQTGNTAAAAHRLPSTGDTNSAALVAAGVAALMGSLALAGTKRRQN